MCIACRVNHDIHDRVPSDYWPCSMPLHAPSLNTCTLYTKHTTQNTKHNPNRQHPENPSGLMATCHGAALAYRSPMRRSHDIHLRQDWASPFTVSASAGKRPRSGGDLRPTHCSFLLPPQFARLGGTWTCFCTCVHIAHTSLDGHESRAIRCWESHHTRSHCMCC
jgi:hypothetical protein